VRCGFRAAWVLLACLWAIAVPGRGDAGRPPEFGWLGVSIAEVGEELADRLAAAFGPAAGTGVQVMDLLKGGPAERALLERGDVIVQVDAQPIWDVRQLQRLLRSQPVDRRVVLTVLRGSSRLTVPVSVGAMPLPVRVLLAGERFGFLAREAAKPDGPAGQPAAMRLVVAFVEAGSSAASAGLRPLDLILQVGDQPIRSLEDFDRVLWAAEKSASLVVERPGAAAPITLILDAAR
jgi:S1-C subfamily serine protease